MRDNPKFEDRYIGDGVYASFDGFGVALDLRGQDSTTRIYMEPDVFKQLIQYHDDAVKAYSGKAA